MSLYLECCVRFLKSTYFGCVRIDRTYISCVRFDRTYIGFLRFKKKLKLIVLIL